MNQCNDIEYTHSVRSLLALLISFFLSLFILFCKFFFLSPTKYVLKFAVCRLSISHRWICNIFTKIYRRPPPPSSSSTNLRNISHTKFIKIIVKHKILWMLNRYTCNIIMDIRLYACAVLFLPFFLSLFSAFFSSFSFSLIPSRIFYSLSRAFARIFVQFSIFVFRFSFLFRSKTCYAIL